MKLAIKLDKMPKSIDKGWIALTVTRIISIILTVFAIVLFIGSINVFNEANQAAIDARAHPNAAEDQPHGLDGLGAMLGYGVGLVLLVVSIILFTVTLTIFFVTSSKIKKKAVLAKQQSQTQNPVITPDGQQPITPPPSGKISEEANEASNNNQQQSSKIDR